MATRKSLLATPGNLSVFLISAFIASQGKYSLAQQGLDSVEASQQQQFQQQQAAQLDYSATQTTSGATDAAPVGLGAGKQQQEKVAWDSNFHLDSRDAFVGPNHLRVYVMPLPHEFNHDVLVRRDKYVDPLGDVLVDDVHMRGTDQFAADTHLYFQWLQSPLRVHTMEEADIVFVPGITARADPFFEQDEHKVFLDMIKNADTLFPNLTTIPHVMGYTRVSWDNQRLIRSDVGRKFTWTTIEMMVGHRYASDNLVLMPYPAHQHYSRGHPDYHAKFDPDAVLASKTILLTETFITRLPFREQVRKHCEARDECVHYEWDNDTKHLLKSLQLAQQSWYCLQPPGDSPTRKSFWDCLFAGSIPVVFDTELFNTLPYPEEIDWNDLLLYIPRKDVEENRNVVDKVKELHTDEEGLRKLQGLHRVRHLLQFSLNPMHELLRFDQVNVATPDDDAFTMTWKSVIRHLCKHSHRVDPRAGPALPDTRCALLQL